MRSLKDGTKGSVRDVAINGAYAQPLRTREHVRWLQKTHPSIPGWWWILRSMDGTSFRRISRSKTRKPNAIDATMGWQGDGTARACTVRWLAKGWAAHAGEDHIVMLNTGRGRRSRSQSPPSAALRHCGVG